MEKGTSKINKIIKQLKERKYRDENEKFLVEGLRFADEIPNFFNIFYYVFSESFCKANDLSFYESRGKCYVFDDKTFREMSDTSNPQGIIAVVEKKQYKIESVIEESKKNSLFIVAENLNDPGNLGTIIRTADACDADGVFLSKGSVDLYNSKVLRSTMGSVFHIPIVPEVDIKDCIDILNRNGIKTYAAHLKGEKMPYDIDLTKPSAFLIGNEARGLSNEISEMADELIKIPMPGKAESLNASVAASVLMYETVRQNICKK